jgi:signal peptidase II
MSRLAQRGILMAALLPLVGCDHATKWAAKETLEGRDPHQLLGSLLDLRYAENTDTAFNLLRWLPEALRTRALLIFGAAAVAALLVALWRTRGGPLARAALALIAAGALGNYLDRLARGYVVDFVHVPHWPVFNVADVYVVAGAALVALAGWKKETATELVLRRRS